MRLRIRKKGTIGRNGSQSTRDAAFFSSPAGKILPILCLSLALHSANAGFEIADLTQAWEEQFRGYTKVWIDYGDSRITAEEWDTYTSSAGYLKNTPRTAMFNAENTFSSPGLPSGQVFVDTIDGYTWKFIAQTQSAMWPYNTTLFPGTINAYQAAFNVTTPPAGSIKFSSNEKNQEMIFWAREGNDPGGSEILRYFITDEWGNQYIMGASGGATPEEVQTSFENAVLPDGWTKSTGFLSETLSLMPAYGPGNQAHYNLFRESGDNTFFQFVWGTDGGSIAGQIEGMPIWGGGTDDTLRMRLGDANAIYGGGGTDTVIFEGDLADWTLVSYADGGAEISLEGFGQNNTLYGVSYLKFNDQTIATSAVPEPSSACVVIVAALVLGARRERQKNR